MLMRTMEAAPPPYTAEDLERRLFNLHDNGYVMEMKERNPSLLASMVERAIRSCEPHGLEVPAWLLALARNLASPTEG